MNAHRLVVGISGSSGAILGIRLLQELQTAGVETHLVITPSARLTIEHETRYTLSEVQNLATQHYNPRDISAPIASGSFQTAGMVVIPCSIKSLSAIANSYSEDLLSRAADVTLKEGRPLILVVREAPLHRGHIRLMDLAAQAGAVLFPPVPAFYNHPQGLNEIVDNIVGRVLQRLGVDNDLYTRWQGLEDPGTEGKDARKEDDEFWTLPSMTLATTTVDGEPHAAVVYFAADPARENLYFFSDPASQHSLDLSTNSRAAVEIHPFVLGWQEIRGLQLRGDVVPIPEGETWQTAWQIYVDKFPFVKDLSAVVTRNQMYTFRPTWGRKVDNRQGFGFKQEWARP